MMFTTFRSTISLSIMLLGVLAILTNVAGSAQAQQQWHTAIEQNPMLTNCGSTTNIPVAAATDCATAKVAAWNLLTTLSQIPNCMSPGCPAGSTIALVSSTCTPDPYTRPNGSAAMRWQVDIKYNCVPPQDSCRCKGWSGQPVTIVRTGSFKGTVKCDSKIQIKKGSYLITCPTYLCIPSSCTAMYKWTVTGPSSGSGVGKAFTFNFSSIGNYSVTCTPWCGGKPCSRCTFRVVVTP